MNEMSLQGGFMELSEQESMFVNGGATFSEILQSISTIFGQVTVAVSGAVPAAASIASVVYNIANLIIDTVGNIGASLGLEYTGLRPSVAV